VAPPHFRSGRVVSGSVVLERVGSGRVVSGSVLSWGNGSGHAVWTTQYPVAPWNNLS